VTVRDAAPECKHVVLDCALLTQSLGCCVSFSAPRELDVHPMPQRRFPRPWRFEPIPGGYRVIDANGLALAHVYGEPPNAIAISDKRLTNHEADFFCGANL